MTIQIRASTLATIALTLVALALLATCGQVKKDHDVDSGVDTPTGDQTCTWDQSKWDSCQLAP